MECAIFLKQNNWRIKELKKQNVSLWAVDYRISTVSIVKL